MKILERAAEHMENGDRFNGAEILAPLENFDVEDSVPGHLVAKLFSALLLGFAPDNIKIAVEAQAGGGRIIKAHIGEGIDVRSQVG